MEKCRTTRNSAGSHGIQQDHTQFSGTLANFPGDQTKSNLNMDASMAAWHKDTVQSKNNKEFYSPDNQQRLASYFMDFPFSLKQVMDLSDDEAYCSGSSEKAASSVDGDDELSNRDEDCSFRTGSPVSDNLPLWNGIHCMESECQDGNQEESDPTMRDCGKLPFEATTRLGWVRPLSPPSSHPGTEGQFSNVTHCPATEPSEGVAIAVTSSGAQQGTATQRLDANGGEEDENEEEKEAVTA